MDHLQPFVLNQPLHTQAFFTLVDTTASLVSVSDKYWQSKGLNGARIRILVEISKQAERFYLLHWLTILGLPKLILVCC